MAPILILNLVLEFAWCTISLMNKQTPPLRVGFDMDGVLLYNPARIIRPFISSIKRFFLHKRKLHFYYPKSSSEKFFWRLGHRSSIYNAPGLHEITKLVGEGKIEAYLITARYSFLGISVQNWVKNNKLDKTFKGVYFNAKDEQPHIFKEKMVKQLGLDMYIEDNFDIVNHLAQTTPAEIVWIYNIFDRGTLFPKKFPHLKQVIEFIRNELSSP
ncbi:MAG: hypothetical protein COX83_03790 [Candidatus Magasanikbacteria bacterium CG_4_10_14_0_2_um_filter_41_31]|uniref:Nucleotidase n=1 Tax=Candidatus Magasanikbacteria bacterium CG_4_10_14_0_2_um_filter_41_31 TaxID=1974639 RepID=A0A2M7V2J1_9BACT|nr:MAG: hypothetical protein COX83_03790 [Candidatus Magasanikbacteria bacterium CG_4_10_14_0_2_um_filter_41_31]